MVYSEAIVGLFWAHAVTALCFLPWSLAGVLILLAVTMTTYKQLVGYWVARVAICGKAADQFIRSRGNLPEIPTD